MWMLIIFIDPFFGPQQPELIEVDSQVRCQAALNVIQNSGDYLFATCIGPNGEMFTTAKP